MRTGLKIPAGMVLFFLFALFSCKSETLEEEMDHWCACEQEAKIDPSKSGQCADMIQDIVKKYEFDPESIVKIQTKVLECKQ